MRKILIVVTILTILFTCVASVTGQDTGGDKRHVTSGLNPQPLPPGRRHYRRGHGHHHKHRGHPKVKS